jgi:hypothetical protein
MQKYYLVYCDLDGKGDKWELIKIENERGHIYYHSSYGILKESLIDNCEQVGPLTVEDLANGIAVLESINKSRGAENSWQWKNRKEM